MISMAPAFHCSGDVRSLLCYSVRSLERRLSKFQVVHHFGTSATFRDSDISDGDEGDSCFIIDDRNLLRKSQNSEAGLYVLDLIDSGSLAADKTLYNKLLRRCTQLGKLKEGGIVHAHILNSEFRDDLVLRNSMLNMYAKCGRVDVAREVFDEMPSRDMVTWTSMITGYSQNECAKDAYALFPQMLQAGLAPNGFTLSSLLKASSFLLSEVHGRQLHALSLKHGYGSNVYVGSSLVDMYARCDHMAEAQLAFDELASKNEVSWNALISGHARKGEAEKALRLFLNMQRENFRPTPFTYSSVFCACSSMGSLERGKWVHAHMIKSGGKLVAFAGNTLLYMYAKSGSINDAKKIFDRFVKRDVVSWNSMLIAYAQHGFGKEAMQNFKEMLGVGIQPNDITFLCVLTACSRAGLLDEGLKYFELMRKYSVKPRVAHYVTIVDLFGRAGLLDQAKSFIEEMPIQPPAAVWGALLGACRMHKNIEMGVYAAERLFELDPYDSGPHVLLANIYASRGRWSDAAKVRKMMKESGVKKEPACSWVEIENSIHMFVADDQAHPQNVVIRYMWETLSEKIKEIGYEPDTSHVLLFVDQHEKEMKLQYHSEKLALAFALLNTPPGSPIHIMKNIRVCGDCHSAIKYVSKVVEREIIVRDTNRFHHFLDGSCSCGDYW